MRRDYGDVWRSVDGEIWLPMATPVMMPFAAGRKQHQMVVFDGSLWVIGGNANWVAQGDVWASADGWIGGGRLRWRFWSVPGIRWRCSGGACGCWAGEDNRGGSNHVWRSADGVDWTEVTPVTGFPPSSSHQAVSLRGSLLVVGGDNVWASADGENWSEVTGAAFDARVNHQVAVMGGSLWMVGGDGGRGGDEGGGLGSDVWVSADGESWSVATADAGFVGRENHRLAVFGGSLWVIGGYDGTRHRDDVWASADGENWFEVTAAAAFAGRSNHEVAVFARRRFVYEVADISVAAVGPFLVSTGVTLPVSLATLTVSGGAGAARFGLIDSHGVLRLGDDGVLVATAVIEGGGYATATMMVQDSTPVNRTPVAVTVGFVAPFSLLQDSVEYVVSPDFVGTVHLLTAVGGLGGYSYARAQGSRALTVGATGALAVTRPLATGRQVMAVFAVTDEADGEVRFTLIVRRALASGAYGNGGMYLVGGDDGSATLGDVWRSENGTDWRVFSSGAFAGRKGHQVVSYRSSLWVVGGEGESGRLGDVWRSADGMGWVSVTIAGTAFVGRSGHQVVSHDGSLWVVGGDDGGATLLGDVWRSANGADWVSVSISGEGFAGRSGHQVVSHGGDLWVIGGDDGGATLGDVWRSENGSVWVSVEVSGSPLPGRSGHQAFSHDGNLWVIGGDDGSATLLGDVWRSADGTDWVSVAVSGTAFVGRSGHQAFSYGGSLWVVGGDDGGATLLGDVWRSADGADWVSVAVSSPSFAGRSGHGMAVHFVSFIYEVDAILVTGETGLTVYAYETAPVTLATLRASGGFGDLRFEMAADAQGVLSVGADGVLVATTLTEFGTFATATLRVRDATPVNLGMAVVTVFRAFSLTIDRSSAEYLVSRSYTGAVHSLGVSGGSGDYAYSRVAGSEAISVGAAGVVSLVATVGGAVSAVSAVLEARDVGGEERVRFTLSVEVVAEADDFAREALYVIGGRARAGGDGSDDVWQSTDGVGWTRLAERTPFGNRHSHEVVAYRDHLWVIGGLREGTPQNDIWRSENGLVWMLVTMSAAFPPKYEHQVVVGEDGLWLVGGRDWRGYRTNDVWRSTDGAVWTLVTTAAPFSVRHGHAAAFYDGSLWVTGGRNADRRWGSDVWRSANGSVWVEATA